MNNARIRHLLRCGHPEKIRYGREPKSIIKKALKEIAFQKMIDQIFDAVNFSLTSTELIKTKCQYSYSTVLKYLHFMEQDGFINMEKVCSSNAFYWRKNNKTQKGENHVNQKINISETALCS